MEGRVEVKSLTQSFLETLSETIGSLNQETGSNMFNPIIAVLTALILASAAAFSDRIEFSMLILLVSVALAFYSQIRLNTWFKTNSMIFLWALIVSAPKYSCHLVKN